MRERKYSKEHEWVSMENGVGTIGISKYAQEKLGDVVYVSLPDVSETIITDEEFGILESVKAANDLFAPVSGEVIEINDDVLDRPSLVNSSPFEEGWLIKVRLSNKKELNNLMSESEYEDFTGGLNQ
ncbi:expressed hypothetical protein [Trichoplax adhaerens]|uniref:Glycine cleavage system H protein n=1 Tax=Trichoplax adhaerens TaxID=10228 RepID=B3RJF5_TRIAD|nr:expressed hypothetical protein [Trichoplax adhaerens]EDV29083.1 expressed hypothetical protein [Trichoplax adhaerens]|eukprot:XP_002108285.1 expressed hypothetical protein [Trichoplax adhaerens]